MRRIPYGETDYVTIRKENSYYVDKTRFIPYFEDAAKYIIFLRPRRFGKSLYLNMLEAYYDILRAGDYEANFGGLDIYRQTTPKQGKYMIMKFNFSTIDSSEGRVEESFNIKTYNTILSFIRKYKDYLPQNTEEYVAKADGKCDLALSNLFEMAENCPYKIYIMIDEYDNFANTLFSTNEDAYRTLTHGDGFFRLFFNVLKAMTTANDAPVERIFITGVSPLTLSDVTSGFNIARNVSLRSQLNGAMGLTESEVRQMLEYYRDASNVFKHSVDELFTIMKPYFNNYCFSQDCIDEERVFNTDMALYFLQNYVDRGGRIPEKMLDPNISTDFFKMEKMVKIEKSFGEKTEIIQKILNEGKTSFELNPEFSIAELNRASILKSLLFYMGLLSFGIDENGYPVFVVPNNAVRIQFSRYMEKCYAETIGWRTDLDKLDTLWNQLSFGGECKPYIAYLASVMHDFSSERDFNAQGEAFVKGFMLSHFCKNTNYTVYTELEANHGFTDLYLEPLGSKRHAYMIELKYCNFNSSDETVAKLKADAESQLQRYLADHRINERCTDRKWELHTAVVVFRGWKLEVLE